MVLSWLDSDPQFGLGNQATVQLNRRAGRKATRKAAKARHDSNQGRGALAPSASRTFGRTAVKECLAPFHLTVLASSQVRFWISVAKSEKLHLRKMTSYRGEGYAHLLLFKHCGKRGGMCPIDPQMVNELLSTSTACVLPLKNRKGNSLHDANQQ